MIELIYPYDIAPLIPAPTADSLLSEPVSCEYFPVVEPSGLVVGRSAREYCHSGKKPLHPVVHLHIIDRYSRIYLQKRAMNKKIQPGKWDTAVGGHVDYGESIVEALNRETSEELGVEISNPRFLCSYLFRSAIEYELINVYCIVVSDSFCPSLNPDEIIDGRFWTRQEIEEIMGKNVLTPNFEQEYLRILNLI